jgi:hypothetical protein
MKLIYNKPINQQIRDLEIREHDWRPIPVRLRVQGCVPGLVFEMSLAMAQALPPPGQWPHATGSLQAMFAAEVDPRFLMSEIIRCRLDPRFFSECYERTPKFGEAILALLIDHRSECPEPVHLDAYIEAGLDARNRLVARK